MDNEKLSGIVDAVNDMNDTVSFNDASKAVNAWNEQVKAARDNTEESLYDMVQKMRRVDTNAARKARKERARELTRQREEELKKEREGK